MRILMVGLDLNPPWVEGIRNTVKLLSQNLIKNQHELFVLTKGNINSPNVEMVEGIKYYRLNAGNSTDYLSGSLIFFLKLSSGILNVIKSEKIDVIHGHSVYPIFGIILAVYSKFTRVPFVFTIYSSPSNKNETNNYPLIMKLLNFSKSGLMTRILAYFSDILVVTSDSTKQKLTDLRISDNKIKYIPIGVNTNLFKPMDEHTKVDIIKSKLNIPLDKKIILFAGDITPWKGLDVFLKSITNISKNFPDIVCIIMTKGIYKYEGKRKEEISNLIKKNKLDKYIFMFGQCDKIHEIYEISDIIVFPFVSLFSVMDTPLSILEAMSVGKPVIATNVGSFNEVVSNMENGLIIEPNSDSQLTEAIIKLLENTNLCRSFSYNSRKSMIEKYDVNKNSCILEKLYEDLNRQNCR